MSTPQGYDFGALYGMADHSGFANVTPGNYDALVETSEYGTTKDGTKGAWTIAFRITTGEFANSKLTMTRSVSTVKQDGSPNPKGMGIMFRQLHAMGIPVGPPVGPPQEQPFWVLGWTEYNVAQAMVGKPVLINVVSDDSYDGSPRPKVNDVRPPRPGAPLQVQQSPVQQQPQYVQQPPQGGYPGQAPPFQQPPQGYPQQPAAQPGYGYPGQQPAPQGPVAPGPWQNAQPQQAPAAPGWTQPPQPGQGGQGEFTPQGQSYQGYPGQAPPNGGAQYGGQQGPPPGYGAPATGAPAPGAQFQPGAPSPSYGQPSQQPQQPQQDPNQPPQGAPNLPPWAS